MKTVEAVLNEVLYWLDRDVPSHQIGRPQIKVVLYEAFQDVFNVAVINDPTFFIYSHTFSSGTSFDLSTLTPKYRDLVLVEVPKTANSSCKSGHARLSPKRDYAQMQVIDTIAGTAADPLCVLSGVTLTISPAVVPTVYYTPYYDETVLSSDATDLETLLPRSYIEEMMLRIMSSVITMHFRDAPMDLRKNLQGRLNKVQRGRELLKASERPDNLAATDTSAPATLQAKAAEGGLLGG